MLRFVLVISIILTFGIAWIPVNAIMNRPVVDCCIVCVSFRIDILIQHLSYLFLSEFS